MFEDFEDEPSEYAQVEGDEVEEDEEVVHFAATQDIERLGAEIMARIDDYYAFIERTGRSKVWRDAYYAYYGYSRDGFHASADIKYAGEEGELVDFKVNQFRSIVNHVVTAVTQDKPKWDPRPVSNSPQDILAKKIAEDVLEHYMKNYKLDRQAWRAANVTAIGGEAFISRLWDPEAGAPTVDTETGETVPGGDFLFRVYHPVDVVRDWRKSWDRTEWMALRDHENVHDLAASYPAYAKEIYDVRESTSPSWWSLIQEGEKVESDDIPIYYFMHKPTPAVPEGRLVILLEAETVLYEGPLPYSKLPVSRSCALEHEGSCFGYSPFWDLLSLQRILDMMVSAGATNYDAFGVQVVAAMKGSEFSPSDLGKGMSILYYPPSGSPPSGINLTQMPDGYFNFMDFLIQQARDISGVNAAVMGNPREALGSGAPAEAMSLLMERFMSYNSGSLRAHSDLLEDLGSGIIETLKVHAENLPRRILTLTRDQELVDHMVTLQGSDLDAIGEVYVEIGSALVNSAAGRKAMVDSLIEYSRHVGQPVFDGPYALYEAMETGNFDKTLDKTSRTLALVRMENQQMLQGELPVVFALDEHEVHIEEHAAVLASPAARQNEQLFKLVAQHIIEHQQNIQAQLPAGGPPQGGGEPPPEGGPPQEPGGEGINQMENTAEPPEGLPPGAQ